MRPLPLALAALTLIALVVWRRRIARPLAAGILVLVAALCVYGSGLITIPDAEHAIREIGPRLGAWTYLLVAGLAFLESGAFVGLIAPGEFAVIFGGFVAGQGIVDPFLLTALVASSATAGDLFSFALGRRLGRPFLDRHGDRFGLDRRRIAALEGFYRRHGGKTIVAGRFVGFARALSPFMAGASRMSLARFAAVDPVGALAWSATFVALGYVFWRSFDRAVVFAQRGNLALFLTLCALAAGVAAVRLARSPEGRHRLRARLGRHGEADQ